MQLSSQPLTVTETLDIRWATGCLVNNSLARKLHPQLIFSFVIVLASTMKNDDKSPQDANCAS